MHEDYDLDIGIRQVWGGQQPFGLCRADRRQHLYLLGKSGTGKTTLLRNLIVQDIEAGRGVAVIDPHGDLALEILDCIPRSLSEKVLYFAPSDSEHPIGLNCFHDVTPEHRHLACSGIVSAFKSVHSRSWGPRLEYLLNATVAALLECENVTLLGIQRMLVDGRYRDWVVRQVKDPAVRMFWTGEFAGYDKRLVAEVILPVQNKVGPLLMAAPLRNILGQVGSRIDARFMMDHRRIFIANLSKGRLGEDNANLLGAFLVTQFQLAAMARADMPEETRQDFHLYIDEAHNFMTDAFASILSEARKYRLCLTLSHQYIEQLRPEIRSAVFGNAGSIVAFRVGEADAEVLAREFGHEYAPQHFTGLANHQICARLLQRGMATPAFTGVTSPPSAPKHGRRENILRRSREKYGTPQHVVEDKIRRWMHGNIA